jgi:putative transcriptional regulator
LIDSVGSMQPASSRVYYEADLGGNLRNKRIARLGHGKSAGFRTIVATRDSERYVFLYGFAKSERTDIDQGEEAALRVWAKTLVTMRHFDRLCLEPVKPLRPAQIRRIRESANVSQAVFAAVLNTSVSSVHKWEIGQKRPTGTALKLLHLVQKNGLDAVA